MVIARHGEIALFSVVLGALAQLAVPSLSFPAPTVARRGLLPIVDLLGCIAALAASLLALSAATSIASAAVVTTVRRMVLA